MNITKLFAFILLFILAALTASAGSYYEFWTAIEDNSQAGPGNAYYIGGDIRVFAQDVTTGDLVFEETKTSVVGVNEHNDFYAAYQYYYPIPTNTVMTVDVDVDGYLTDGRNAIDQFYISSGLTQAFITLRAQDQAGQTPDVWTEEKDGFSTTCQFIRIQNSNGDLIPYLECSMERVGEDFTSGMFLFTQFLIAGDLEDIVISTTKVYPEAQSEDKDGDGWGVDDDCDDDPSDDPSNLVCPATKWECTESTSGCAICRYPGALEVCDGFDNNCNNIDDYTEGVCDGNNCQDADGDGFNVPITSGAECGPIDCDDRVINGIPVGFLRNPDAFDSCNGFDDNCDCWSLNNGQGVDTNNDGIVCGPGDLNVDNGYGSSNECTSYTFYCDADGDGEVASSVSGTCDYYGCIPNACQLTPGFDCDDSNPNRYPGNAEVCDGIDNDCDAGTADGSGEIPLLNPNQVGVCAGSQQVCLGGQWNPNYANIAGYENPELSCDNLDNDCDGSIDENNVCGINSCEDVDNDGYFVPLVTGASCGQIDCNDNDANINPGATEVCNGIDDDCNGATPDGSGEQAPLNDNQAGVCAGSEKSCISGNWLNAYIGILNYENPEASCDNLDNDCDGSVDENNVCQASVISTSMSPTHPLDSQDVTCSITVNNLYDPNNNDVTVHYALSGGVTASGSFNCPNGNCAQDLLILAADTPENTTITCSASFTYNSQTHQSQSSVYIYPDGNNNNNIDTNPVPQATVSRARFVDGDTVAPGEELTFEIRMANKGYDLEGLKAQVMLIGVTNAEYQRFSVGPFDLEKGDETSAKLYIPIPQNTKRGMYYARVSIGDGDYRYVKHRVFFVV